MTAAEVMQLEALKQSALTAMSACRSVVMAAESLLVANDQSDQATALLDTFDTPAPNEADHGRKKASQRR